MATILVKNRGGLRLKFEVSTRSKPRIRQAYPIPDFPDATTSLLSLALEVVIQTGRKGVRVISTPDTLPGGPDAVWTLFHAAYQGTLPDPLSYEALPVAAPKVNLLIDPALPKATHKFYLQRVEGGKTYTYTEASIATPDDALAPLSLEGILADDLVSANAESTALKGYYDAIITDQAILDVQADDAGSSRTTYDAAVTTLTAGMAAISPAYTTLTVDHPLGSGGGATLLAKFKAVYSARDALRIDIAKLQSSDSFLTPLKKRDVKAQWTRIKLEQVTLDSAADLAGISRTTYDTAITTLYTYLDGLTDVGGSAGGAWTGSTSSGDWASYTAACGVTGTTLRADLAAIYAARDALLVALGNTGILDDVITGPQKVIIKADRDKYYNGFYTATTGLKDQAIAAGVSWTACDTAIAALETHLATYTSANGWNTGTHDWKNLNTLVLSAGGGATLALHCNAGSIGFTNGAINAWLLRVQSNGDVVADGEIYHGFRLRGGTGDCGALKTWSTDNTVRFRWDGPGQDSLFYRIDEVNDRAICTQTNAKEIGLAGGTGGPLGVSLNVFDRGGALYGIYADAASDERIKQNIRPTEVDALDLIMRLELKSYDIKPEVLAWFAERGLSAPGADSHVPIGIVAQDLQALAPEAVGQQNCEQPDGSPIPNDMKTVVHQMMVPYLLRAVQQLSARVAELEARGR